jgi:hypothetical protein
VVLKAAGTRRIVAVVRDEHRHPWMAATLDTLLAARPDTVVVEMGVPQAPPRGALHIATHGAARVCGHAAAEVIAGDVTVSRGSDPDPRIHRGNTTYRIHRCRTLHERGPAPARTHVNPAAGRASDPQMPCQSGLLTNVCRK